MKKKTTKNEKQTLKKFTVNNNCYSTKTFVKLPKQTTTFIIFKLLNFNKT